MRSSSGVLLLNRNREFLLQHREKKRRRFPDFWAFFGGKIEGRENPEMAARRELKEELNIKLKNLIFVGKYGSKQRKEIQFIFTAKLTDNLNNLKKQQKEGNNLKIFSFKESQKSKIPRLEKSILKNLYKRKIIN